MQHKFHFKKLTAVNSHMRSFAQKNFSFKPLVRKKIQVLKGGLGDPLEPPPGSATED